MWCVDGSVPHPRPPPVKSKRRKTHTHNRLSRGLRLSAASKRVAEPCVGPSYCVSSYCKAVCWPPIRRFLMLQSRVLASHTAFPHVAEPCVGPLHGASTCCRAVYWPPTRLLHIGWQIQCCACHTKSGRILCARPRLAGLGTCAALAARAPHPGAACRRCRPSPDRRMGLGACWLR